MSNHTPGPWSYWSGYNPFDKIEAQVTAENGDIVIASYNHLIEEGEANARLMSLSPQLLLAIEDALVLIKEISEHVPSLKQRVTAYENLIEKAKGR